MSMISLLVLPVIGMIFLTIGIALWMLKLRYRAVLQDGVSPAYFKLNKGAKLPDYLVRVTQHFENLFETPILFYIVILFILTIGVTDIFYVCFAWLFFIARLAHAYVHTTYNRIKHRRNVFIISSLLLVVLWAKLTVDVVML